MEKELLSWVNLYQSKCKENSQLRAEIELLQKILHCYLEVVDGKDHKSRKVSGD